MFAWVGFTASTGGLNQNHDIIFFSFENASVDCNADGIPDDCQLDGNDCNADGIPDECQLAGNDVNANNIPDGCELDCNNNGLPDDIDLANCPMGDISCADCNGNGVLDSWEVARYSKTLEPIPKPRLWYRRLAGFFQFLNVLGNS